MREGGVWGITGEEILIIFYPSSVFHLHQCCSFSDALETKFVVFYCKFCCMCFAVFRRLCRVW